MRLSGLLLFLFLLLIQLGGCTPTHKTGTDSKTHLYPKFTAKGNIFITNLQKVQFHTIDLDGPNYTIDMIEIVESAKQQLEQQIQAAKSSAKNDLSKTIGLSVSSVHVSGIFKVTIYIRVDLGNGETRGVEAIGESWLLNQAIDNATYNIPEKILYSSSVLDYLEE